jgi:hypothetical protein
MLEVTLALVLVEVDGASLRFTFLEAQALEGLLNAVALLFWGAVVCLFCRTFFVSLTDSSSFSVRALLSESSSWSLGLLKIPESKNGSGSLAQVTLALVEVEVGHSIKNSIYQYFVMRDDHWHWRPLAHQHNNNQLDVFGTSE